MNFFKRLFSSNRKYNNEKRPGESSSQDSSKGNQENKVTARLNSIASKDYFDQRYQEEEISESLLDGTLKMIESYFVANNIEPTIKEPINHPKNLDQTIEDGFGFVMYCRAMEMGDEFAVGLLAMAFNDFMIKKHGFKLYKDSEPEFPLRDMTLKYDNKGTKLSIYPMEYTAKVVRYEADFNSLYQKIKTNLENLPTSDEVYKKMMEGLNNKTD